jgi:hypothetical protein
MERYMSKKEDNVRIVYFKVGKDPEIGNMENTVDGMQKVIGGGYVQVVNIGAEGMVILCDEEGLIKDLPYNRGLRGDWIIVGTDEDEFVSLTDQQVEWIKQNVGQLFAILGSI